MPTPHQVHDPAEEELRPIVLESLHVPWYRSLLSSIRDAAASRLLPPVEVSSAPLPVRSIWGAYDHRGEGLLYSSFTHLVLVVLALGFSSGIATRSLSSHSIDLRVPVDLSASLVWLRASGTGGGGGGKDLALQSSRGNVPRFETAPLVAPAVVEKNADPKLPVPPALLGPADFRPPVIDAAVLGNPLGVAGPPSDGPGSDGGLGGGKGTSVGSGEGPGFGSRHGSGVDGVYHVGGGVSAPVLRFKVEPEYSEDARKARMQGTVVLRIEVWPDGKAHNIHVVRSLGLGLDNQALRAVRQWVFQPGTRDGIPVRVEANVEVSFRLL